MADAIRKALLLAAGRGTRLGELTAKTPKPMLDVAGAPIVARIVDSISRAGVCEFVIVTGYLGEQIEEWSRAYCARNRGVSIACVRQRDLTGTGGAIAAARNLVESEGRFIFGWGDILMERDNYPSFIRRAQVEEFDLMLAVNRVADPFQGAAVYVDSEMRVVRLEEKPARGTSSTNWNNAGLFAATQSVFEYVKKLEKSPRGEYELPRAIAAMVADGRVVRAVEIRGFWSDVGTPRDLEIAREHFGKGDSAR